MALCFWLNRPCRAASNKLKQVGRSFLLKEALERYPNARDHYTQSAGFLYRIAG
jgi:hypothetical protein